MRQVSQASTTGRQVAAGAVAQDNASNDHQSGMRRAVTSCDRDGRRAAPCSAGFRCPILIPINCLLLGFLRGH